MLYRFGIPLMVLNESTSQMEVFKTLETILLIISTSIMAVPDESMP